MFDQEHTVVDPGHPLPLDGNRRTSSGHHLRLLPQSSPGSGIGSVTVTLTKSRITGDQPLGMPVEGYLD